MNNRYPLLYTPSPDFDETMRKFNKLVAEHRQLFSVLMQGLAKFREYNRNCNEWKMRQKQSFKNKFWV